jgi:hypothetical protein
VIILELTDNYIENFAGNAGTVTNSKKLAKNGSFQNLCVSHDGTLLFGECKGSGKNPYNCSVDFINEGSPVARCSCPSRQIPCKHAVGLLYARLNGNKFTMEDIPDDIKSKRDKLDKKEENKSKKAKPSSAEPPTKAKINTALKKIDMQLEGVGIAEKLLTSIVETGLAGIDAKMRETLSEQIIQLGNYYINGVQTALNELLIAIKSNVTSDDFRAAKFALLYVSALLQNARTHFEEKKNNPLTLNIDSAIEEQTGYVWKLEELRTYGSFEENAELVQLGFYSYDDTARKELVDEGYFISLKSGRIYKKINYRPYKALKYVKQDDSVFDVLCVKEMFYYPGFLNPRCRYDEYTVRTLTSSDYDRVISFAYNDFSAAHKTVKNQIKSPLADKNPLILLKPHEIDGLVITDKNGVRQTLSDSGYIKIATADIFKRINITSKEAAILVMFSNDIDMGLLTAKPVSIILPDRIIRLAF